MRSGDACAASRPPRLAFGGLLASATTSGTLVLASFPPFDFSWTMWVALVPLFAVHRRVGRPLLLLYGYVLAAVPIWPIAFGIAASSVPAFLLFAASVPAAFAMAIAAATTVESRLRHPVAAVLVFPCCAVAIESILGTETIGVPVTLALTQTGTPFLVQNADLFGTAGTTFLLLLVNRALAAFVVSDDVTRQSATPVAIAAALFALNAAYGWHRLGKTDAGACGFDVASIQPVISTADYVNHRIDSAVQDRIDRAFEELMTDALRARPDLLVLSEGGNGRYNFRVPALRRRLEAAARRSGAGLLVSSLDLTPADEEFNALFSLDADGTLRGTYRKRVLTPFGEEHLSAGGDRLPLPSTIGPVGAMVCFESCFPDVARTLVSKGASVLLVSTSDASFRNSALPLLHSRFSVFRAIETRRYLVQAANTGPSLVVTPSGTVAAGTTFLERGVLRGRVVPRHDETLFVRAPWLAPAGAFGFLLAACAFAARRRGPSVPEAGILRFPSPPRAALLGLAYGIWVAVLCVESVDLSTRGTFADRGAFGNLAEFLAAPPGPDMQSTAARFLQRGSNTCGPAAVAYLLHLHGVEASEDDIARHVEIAADGTSLLDLARAVEAFGVTARGERWNLAALRAAARPVIAHLPSRNHFVVVTAVVNGSVFMFDPAIGAVALRVEEFAREWDGYTLRIAFRTDDDLDRPFDPDVGPASADGMLLTTRNRLKGEPSCAPNNS